MKTLLPVALLCAALTTTPAFAVEGVGITCEQIGHMAGSIQEGHQKGMPMSTFMAMVDKPEYEGVRDAVKMLITAAYEVPTYFTEELQKKAIADFRNTYELACYKGPNAR